MHDVWMGAFLASLCGVATHGAGDEASAREIAAKAARLADAALAEFAVRARTLALAPPTRDLEASRRRLLERRAALVDEDDAPPSSRTPGTPIG